MVVVSKKWCSFNFMIKNKIPQKSNNTWENFEHFYIKKGLYLGENLTQKYNIARWIRNFRSLVLRQWGLFSDNDTYEGCSSANFSTNNFIKRYNIYKQFINMGHHIPVCVSQNTDRLITVKTDTKRLLLRSLEKSILPAPNSNNWAPIKSETSYIHHSDEVAAGLKFLTKGEACRLGVEEKVIGEGFSKGPNINNSGIMKPDSRSLSIRRSDIAWKVMEGLNIASADMKRLDEKVSCIASADVKRLDIKRSQLTSPEINRPYILRPGMVRTNEESPDFEGKHTRAFIKNINVMKTNYNEISREKLQKVIGLKNSQLPVLQNYYSEVKSKPINNSYGNNLNNALNVNALEVSKAKLFKNLIGIEKDDFIENQSSSKNYGRPFVYNEEINVKERNDGFNNSKKISLYTPSDTLTFRKPVMKEVVQDDEKKRTPEKHLGDTANSTYTNEKCIQKQRLKELENEEINILADKVYKTLEKRISIQKDKRGVW